MSRIVITGASDGIGKSIAIKLAAQGHDLVLFGRDSSRLAEVAKRSNNAEFYCFDLNNIQALNDAVEAVISGGRVDVLINNAGVWHKVGDLDTITDEKIAEVINTNLTAQIILTKKTIPTLKKSKGIIVNIVSKSGITTQAGQTVYSASKWGLRGFTDVLREDLKEYGVRVFGVYQSGTNTKLFEKAGDDFPIDEFTNPDDLAEVISYMLHQPKNLKINEIRIDR